jgi:arsenite oxidase small subunit
MAHCPMTRRKFLKVMGGATASVMLSDMFFHPLLGRAELVTTPYPRKKIGKLSLLKKDQPIEFLYPDKSEHSICFFVKLGERAHGGVGPQEDIVAFSNICTHQGGLMRGLYDAQYKVSGPCPLHLTTFDLTRHGMVVSGHATEGLPQIVLKIEDDDIYAIGVQGLIYGQASNLPSQ